MTVGTSDLPEREPAPAGYREVLYWRIGDKRWRVIVLNLLALVSVAPWLFVFYGLGLVLGRMPPSGDAGLAQVVLVLAAGLLTVVLHEFIHGFAMQANGAHVRYGVLPLQLMVYATAPGHAFSRAAYLITGLAPLVSISVLALLAMVVLAGSPWVGLVVLSAAGNAAAATGDLWIVGVVLRYPAAARLIDERDGVRILLPDPA